MPYAEKQTHPEPEGSPDPKQSGALKPDHTAPVSASTSVQHKEPEDAYLTGGQRNLQRRMLGLNVEGSHSQRPAAQSPGLHSTGSFTGVANGEDEPRKEESGETARQEKAS